MTIKDIKLQLSMLKSELQQDLQRANEKKKEIDRLEKELLDKEENQKESYFEESENTHRRRWSGKV